MKTNQFSIIGAAASALLLSASHLFSAGVIDVSNHQNVGPLLDLDPAKTYLHTLDFPADGTGDTINGVTFSAVGGDAGTDPITGNPYGLFMAFPTEFGGTGLLGDFLYNGSQPEGAAETLTLGGFVPGTTYDVRLYYRSFGPRPQDVTIDTDGVSGAEWSGVLDQDTAANENYWSIVFQADTPEITIQFVQQVFNAAWHQYGLSTEVVPVPDGQPVAITAQPQNQTVREGGVAAFHVVASGSTPLTFQWRKGGISILDATNMVLVIRDVKPGDADSYDVVVHNDVLGDEISGPATLTVGPAVDFSVSKVAGITVNGLPGRTAQIDGSGELGPAASWVTLTNIVLSGETQIVVDPTVTNAPTRFYRGQLPP